MSLNRKEQRRLNFLCSTNSYTPIDTVNTLLEYEWNKNNRKLNEIKEAHQLFDKLDYNDNQRFRYWMELSEARKEYRKEYQRKPIRVRKDNKDTINYGSGSGGSNNIRFPKKKRKTAWKRFYKLFPKLDPSNKKE